MPVDKALATKRGRYSGLRKAVTQGLRSPDDPEVREAAQSFAAEVMADHARKLVAKWPPLTPEQIAHVANVLSNGATGGGD